MPVKKPSATEAMNLYEEALRTLPEISSLHLGFDEDMPVIIATVHHVSDELQRKIDRIAPNAPIKLIPVGVTKPVSAAAAAKKYGRTIRKVKAVASVDVCRKGGTAVLVVRAFPLTDHVKASIRSAAPDAPLEFKESRHSKNSAPSVLEFLGEKLKVPILSLVAVAIMLTILSPLYYATNDFKFAVGATSAAGAVLSADRPVRDADNRDEIFQDVTVKFLLRDDPITFTQKVRLFNTLRSLDNVNAEPYHKGMAVTVSYQSADPEGTARIFDRTRFWATIAIYVATIALLVLMSVHGWRKWQEW